MAKPRGMRLLNGDGDLADRLVAAGFNPSGESGRRDALWGPCDRCKRQTNMVDLSKPSLVAVCRCGNRQPVPGLLQALEGERGLPLKTLAELAAEAPPEADDWLVQGLLPVDGISLLVAPPKAGKSTLARTLAAAIAGGRTEWLGRSTARTGAVIHLALEERSRTVLNHYARLEADSEGIHLLVGPAPKLATRLPMLRRSIETLKPALVIIDPLQRWVRISDGNAYSEATEALTPLIELARSASVHLLLVHHARKRGGEWGSEALGSTAFGGSVDTTLSLKLSADGRRRFYAIGRDGVDVESTLLTMDERGWVTAAGTEREDDLAAFDGRVLEWLAGRAGPATLDEIRQGLESGRTKASNALRRLVARSAVEVAGEGKRNDPHTYSVSVPAHI